MKSEWQKVPIESLCIGIYDGPHATPPKSDSGAVFLGISNFSNGRLDLSNIRYISEDDLPRWTKRVTPKAHDIVFSYEATLNLYAIIPEGFYGCLGRRMALMRPDESKVDYRFLYYYMYSSQWREEIDRYKVNGSTVDRIPLVSFPSFTVNLPNIVTQRSIADILSAIDDKIELNNKINANLEQQLCTFFKERFADNALLENMPQVPLSDLCSVITKGTTPTTLGKPFVERGINFIKAESLTDKHSIDTSKFAFINIETHSILKRSIIQDKDILFTIAGTLGRFVLIDESVLPANTNQAVAIIRADKRKASPYYLYSFFIGNWHNDYYTKRIQQAVQANLSLTTIKSLPIPMLNATDMDLYLNAITPLIKAMKSSEHENAKLAEFRNALLPKLMSGEIEVSAIEI